MSTFLLIWAASYIVPVTRTLCRGCGIRVMLTPRRMRWLAWIGRIEWTVACLRDLVGIIGPSWLLWHEERQRRQRLLELAQRERYLHPHDFFEWYFASHGPFPVQTLLAPEVLRDSTFDARTGSAARTRLWPLLHALASTYFMSSLVLRATRQQPGSEATRALVSNLMAIWGARIAQLWRVRIQVEESAQLENARGPIVLCPNHVSAMDFVALPVALTLSNAHYRPPCDVRFLAARDHFLDNWFIRRVLRLGDAMDAAEMVFVHRAGTPQERAASVTEAVERMTERHIDVIVFPQGTRAPARPADAADAPAGYFTAGGARRARVIGAQCKPGAARMAIAAAQQVGMATLVPVAMIGTEQVLPSRCLRVRTQQSVTIRFGAPIVVDATMDDASALTARLDMALRDALQCDAQLLAWAAANLCAVDAATVAVHPQRDTLLATLDCIIQLPADTRATFLLRWRAAVTDTAIIVDVLHRDVVAAWEVC